MATRTRHKLNGVTLYAVRDKQGRFTDIQKPGRSSAADRRKKAKYAPAKRGQGNQGDYSAPKKNWLKRIFS